MRDFKVNFDLRKYNSFGIQVQARFFIEIDKPDDLKEVICSDIYKSNSRLILGGGSNILFTENFNGLVLHSRIKDISVADENDEYVFVRVGSGMVWDEFVAYSVKKKWGGVENLSNIPGSVGASPVQNIGAYGIEVKDVIDNVEGINLKTNETTVFSAKDCEFEYRNSLFKRLYKNDFFITRVTFKLKKFPHELITHYGDIEKGLNNLKNPNISDLRKIICDIRSSKLPDVDEAGNAGSFFKNPIVTSAFAKSLSDQYEDIPIFRHDNLHQKLSAAWLIDKSGCRNIKQGNAGTHPGQPLVLVNLGGAKGSEIRDLAHFIRQRVKETFNVKLEPEVNMV